MTKTQKNNGPDLGLKNQRRLQTDTEGLITKIKKRMERLNFSNFQISHERDFGTFDFNVLNYI